MDLDNLKSLIALMNDNDLVEIEIEEEGHKVRLVKKPEVVVTRAEAPAMPVQPSFGAPMEGMPAAAAPAHPPDTVTINSPMVGTFYRQPSPDAEPYVEVGQDVTPDTVLCIIEAMKVMNEIKAEADGKILEILVGNGEPVEYGQPLFLLKPLKSSASA
jgi:acetyl-CoA carboxylase biotin carboxyl carrier protein